jgi:hypothetical protein
MWSSVGSQINLLRPLLISLTRFDLESTTTLKRDVTERYSVDFIPEAMEQIIVAVITLVGVLYTAWIGYKSHSIAREVNDAVNHRHRHTDENGEVPPKLYDLAINNSLKLDDHKQRLQELQEWKRGYRGSAFPDADSINGFVDSIEKRIVSLEVCKFKTKCDKDCDKK